MDSILAEAKRLGVSKICNLGNWPFTESFKTLPTLLNEIPAERVLFGSYTPFFYTASAVAKLDALRKIAGRV